jgi:tetratricopeptide (TPR) repeat protein
LYPYFPLENSRLVYLLFPLLVLIIAGFYGYAVKKKNKYIIFGGLFFLVNILFSIGLQIVAVRPAVMADRYVYLSSIGIFLIIAKGADILIEKKLIKPALITVFFIAFFLITANLTYSRTKIWKNSLTIWNDVIGKYQTIAFAYYLRGSEENNSNDFKKAIDDYNKAIAIRPNFAKAYANRGATKFSIKDFKGTIEDCNKAIALFPNYADAYLNRGAAKANLGNIQEAIEDFNKAIAINPNYVDAYNNRGVAKANMGDNLGAIADFNSAISINNKFADAYFNRGFVNFCLSNFKCAIDDLEEVLKQNPNNEKAVSLKAKAQQELQKGK